MLFIAFWKVLNKKPYAILNLIEEDDSQQQQVALVIVSFDPSHLYFFNGLFASQNVRNHKTYISLVDSRLSTYLPMSI